MGPEPAGIKQFQELIIRLINLSVGLAFIVMTIMFFYGGFKYITSAGDPKNLAAAKSTLIWAFIGVLILAVAYVALYIVEAFTGVEVTKFCIGFPGATTNCR